MKDATLSIIALLHPTVHLIKNIPEIKISFLISVFLLYDMENVLTNFKQKAGGTFMCKRAISRSLLTVSILVTGIFFSVPVMAYNVVVDNLGGISSNGSFVNHVWTPTGEPSNLSWADLQTEISSNNVEIITNGSGTITIIPVFNCTLASDRQLTLTAQGGITIGGINALAGTGKLNVVAHATGPVSHITAGTHTNGGSFTSYGTDFSSPGGGISTSGGNVLLQHTGTVSISGGGIRTGGGSFTSYGTDFSVSASALGTEGGNVNLHHSGTVSIIDFGVQTGGGSFTSSGTDFITGGNGLLTNGGNAVLNHTGTVTITSIRTDSGSFTSSGTDLLTTSSGLQTGGGNARLNHSGNLNLTEGGINTGGGSFTSSGTGFRTEDNGLRTFGGNASLTHTGNLEITEGGIGTDGGDLRINSSATASFSGNGVYTNGGTILVQSNGLIHVNTGAGFTSGPANGGDITLRSATGITLDSPVSSLPGTGGVLSLEGNTAAIVLNMSPVLGAGNITLYVGSLQPASIPTLSEWGMIIMSFILLMAALQAIRQKTGFSSQA
ncbi:MAG: IPTL-CTERM sorting domain-containing protein [Desulfobacteraceae bacterium]|nr:MAG: IPTL-CTERM sorting domain-containing protein [Desulfobacteraceae bacterium]